MKSERKLTAEEARREAHGGVRCLVTLAENECANGPHGFYSQAEHLDSLIDAAIAAAVREEREACATIADDYDPMSRPAAMVAKLRELESAAILCAEDVACFTLSEDDKLIFFLVCNDTFGWATADGEELPLSMAPELLKLYKEKNWPGIIQFIADRRKQEPLPQVRKRMTEFDAALAQARRETAEACISVIKAIPLYLSEEEWLRDNTTQDEIQKAVHSGSEGMRYKAINAIRACFGSEGEK